MAKKKQYFMERINNNNYYTNNKKLYEKKLKQDKWKEVYDNCGIFWVLSFIIGMIAIAPQEEFMWKSIVCWVITGIGAIGCIAIIILATVASKKIDKYEWENEFENSIEFTKQLNKYKKIEKEKQDKIKREKATKLVESYEILDNKQISKEEKINLIKEYID